MEKSIVKKYRHKLETMQKALQERSARTSQHLYHREEPYSADFAEQAVELENEDVVGYLDEDAKATLLQIQHALQRIDNGEYGVCTRCGHKINEQRLLSIPYTPVCIACAEAA